MSKRGKKRKLVAHGEAPRLAGSSVQPKPSLTNVDSEPSLGRFHRALALVTILVFAAALRLAHLKLFSQSPLATRLQFDHRFYDEWAVRIAGGDWLGGAGAFFVDPLYAYFLAGIYALFGHSLTAARLAQLILGVGTCALTGILGRRATSSTTIGLAAAALQALCIPSIFYEAGLEKTGLGVFLSTLALVILFGEGRARFWLGGLVLGLAVLARGNLLLMVPLAAILLAWPDQVTKQAHPSRSPRWKGLQFHRAALFLASAIAVISPAIVRNLAVSGDALVTYNLGPNFYLGNHRSPRIAAVAYPPFVRPDTRYEETDFRAEAEQRAGRPLKASEVSSFWLKEGLREIAAAPAEAIDRFAIKLVLFFHQFEVPDNENMDVMSHYSPILKLPVVGMGLLVPLAALGFFVGWNNRRLRVLAVVSIVYAVSVIAFLVLGKLRMQLTPVLAVAAAFALVWLHRQYAARSWGRLSAAAVALLALSAVVWHEGPWIADQHRRSKAIAFNNLGSMFNEAGDRANAIEAMEQAVAIEPRAVVAASRSLGDFYLEAGDFEKAEGAMLRVLVLKPQSQLARQALHRLASAYRAAGLTQDADRVEDRAAQ